MSDTGTGSAELLSRLEKLPFSRWHLNLAIIAGVGVLLDATDFAMFGAALPPIAREFGLSSAQSGLLATIAIFSVFTVLTALSWNVLSLAVLRFISNFGLGGQVPVALTITSEFMPGRLRGRVSSSVLATFPLGLAVAAGLSLVLIPTLGWRALFAVGVLPALMLLLVRRYMPESVRYLISRGKTGDAERTVQAIERAALPDMVPRPAPPARRETGVEQGITVVELLTPGRRRTTILLWIVSFCFFWSSNGILFMLPTILTQRGLPLSQALGLQLVQGIAGTFGYSICGFLIDRFGRRPVLFLYFFVGAVFHLWFATASGLWMWVAIALVGWVNPGVYGPTGVYVGELYPTHLRATATGWFFGIGRVGSFLAPAVVGLMLQFGIGSYVLHTFALTFFIASIAIVAVGIETRGLTLEQSQALANAPAA
ncbi:MAG: MFS transporter [Alphaproteobacteria bacterium]|nr:MFS transporter [Alphaproteobacteria bacterium]